MPAVPPIYIFEDSHVANLFPLTYARPACLLRCGALTLLDRLARHLPASIAGLLVRAPLAPSLRKRTTVPVNPPMHTTDGVLLINARWLLTNSFDLPPLDSAGVNIDSIVYAHISADLARNLDFGALTSASTLERILPKLNRITTKATLIARPWDLLTHHHDLLLKDFSIFGAAQNATLLGPVHQLATEAIHLAKNVSVYPNVVIDAHAGPVIVDEGAQIKSNAVLTGPLYIGKNCLIRTAADIREDNSIAEGCRVGGEIMGSILLPFVNKQHHGFMGQSIVGEFVNIGGGTTTSNLKNTYGTVRMPLNGTDEETHRQFLGSVIGDHARVGIGAYLSTGSIVGLGSHIMVSRPPRFTPSFAWVTDAGIARLDFAKFEQIATTAMARRNVQFTSADHELFVAIAGDWSTIEKFTWRDG